MSANEMTAKVRELKELMATIAEENPIRESEQTGLAPIDIIGWMVRNAYKLGYMTATVTLILYRLIQNLVERERGLAV